jgi:hypothetical protein
MHDFNFSCPSIIASSESSEWIRLFLCLPLATLWKYLVFESPSNKNWDLDRWYHLSSSSRSKPTNFALNWFFKSISCIFSCLISAMAFKSPIDVERPSFYFLSCLVVRRTHPPRYIRTPWSLLFHLWIGVPTTKYCSHIFLTISENPSLCNHPSSNLNEHLWGGEGMPVLSSMGEWSNNDSILGRVCPENSGYFCSQFESISTLSSFSYVGWGRLFSQVNCLTIIDISFKSKLSLTTLNRNDQLLSTAPLLFSCGNLSKLKSPPIIIGCGLLFARLTNSRRNACLKASWAAP